MTVELLERSILYYRGKPIGTIAARDPTISSLNYDQTWSIAGLLAAQAFIARPDCLSLISFELQMERPICKISSP